MTGIPRFDLFEDELRDEFGAPSNKIFTVSGLAGVGTSTISTFLAEHYGMDRIDAGGFFRGLAKERGMDIQEFDEKAEEIEAEEGVDFDIEWDKTALRYGFTRDDLVLEGRLAGALLQDVAPIRVWVSCDTDLIAERITGRESLSVEDAREHILVRNKKVRDRYMDKYGIDPTDERFYNVFINNSGSLNQVKKELLRQIDSRL